MSNIYHYAVGTAVLFAIAVQLLCLKIRVLAQQDRLRMARLGRELLDRKDVPGPVRRHITYWMDNAFGDRIHLVAVMLALPVRVPKRLFNSKRPLVASQRIAGSSAKTQRLFAQFDDLTSRLLFFNNPVMMLMCVAEVIVIYALAFPCVVIWQLWKDRPNFPQPPHFPNRDALLTSVVSNAAYSSR